MGLSLDRSATLQTFFGMRMDEIFIDATNNHRSQTYMLHRRNVIIFLHKSWNKNLSGYVKHYLAGYWDARINELYRHHLEWRTYVIDSQLKFRGNQLSLSLGKLCSNEEVQAMKKQYGDFCPKVNNTKGQYVWMAEPTKLFTGVE